MEPLKIFDSVIDDLYLLLYHGHSPGKTIVLPDFAGQFVNLGFHDCLASAVGNQDTQKGDAAGDD